jgi:cytochrome c oxidase subunit 2
VAADVDALFYFIFFTALIIFILVVGGIIYFSFKYRRRGDQAAGLTSGVDHNRTLELVWTIIPTILVVIVFAWGFKTFLRLNVVPRNAMEIKVTGKRWLWTFDYPSGQSTINELVVPVNQPVKLLLSSEDMIHSFFVPNFRVKMDVLPNRYTVTWFEALVPGEYDLFCAEYCGTGHSQMLGKVKVLPQEAYEAWLAGAEVEVPAGGGESLLDLGAKLYQQKACFTCHTTDGTPLVGPTLKGVFGREERLTDGSTVTVDENYLRRSLLDPQAEVVAGYQPVMPTFQGLLTDRELDALIAYIKGLKE